MEISSTGLPGQFIAPILLVIAVKSIEPLAQEPPFGRVLRASNGKSAACSGDNSPQIETNPQNYASTIRNDTPANPWIPPTVLASLVFVAFRASRSSRRRLAADTNRVPQLQPARARVVCRRHSNAARPRARASAPRTRRSRRRGAFVESNRDRGAGTRDLRTAAAWPAAVLGSTPRRLLFRLPSPRRLRVPCRDRARQRRAARDACSSARLRHRLADNRADTSA